MVVFKADETTAEAFFNTAQQYHLAARTLLPRHQQAESPLYFLFVHTIELAFKTYLRSRGIVTPRAQRGHALRDLLEQCHRNGLQVDLDLRNVVQLLESENSRHGFRHFSFEGTGRPDITYLREVVNELMRVIEEEVCQRPTTGLSSVVLKFIVDRPQKDRRCAGGWNCLPASASQNRPFFVIPSLAHNDTFVLHRGEPDHA